MTTYARSVDLAVAQYGADDPDAAVSRLGLARIQRAHGQTEEAERNYVAALAVLEAQRGAANLDRLRGLQELAELKRATDRAERAAELEAEAARASQKE